MAPVNDSDETPRKKKSPQKRVLNLISNGLKKKKSKRLKGDSEKANDKDKAEVPKKSKEVAATPIPGPTPSPAGAEVSSAIDDHNYDPRLEAATVLARIGEVPIEIEAPASAFGRQCPLGDDQHVVYFDPAPDKKVGNSEVFCTDTNGNPGVNIQSLIDCLKSQDFQHIQVGTPTAIAYQDDAAIVVTVQEEEVDEDELVSKNRKVQEPLDLTVSNHRNVPEPLDLRCIFDKTPPGSNNSPEIVDPNLITYPREKTPTVVVSDPEQRDRTIVFIDDHNELIISKTNGPPENQKPLFNFEGKNDIVTITPVPKENVNDAEVTPKPKKTFGTDKSNIYESLRFRGTPEALSLIKENFDPVGPMRKRGKMDVTPTGEPNVYSIDVFCEVRKNVINRGPSPKIGLYSKEEILGQFFPAGKEFWIDCHYPDSFREDLILARSKEEGEEFQYFGEAVEFIFRNEHFFDRLCNLLRYDCYLNMQYNPHQFSLMTDDQIVNRIKCFRSSLWRENIIGETGEVSRDAILMLIDSVTFSSSFAEDGVDSTAYDTQKKNNIAQDFLVAFSCWLQQLLPDPCIKRSDDSLIRYTSTLGVYCTANFKAGIKERLEFHTVEAKLKNALFAAMAIKKTGQLTPNMFGEDSFFRLIPMRLVADGDVWDYTQIINTHRGRALERKDYEHELLYLEILTRIACNYQDLQQFKRCSQIAEDLMTWMLKYKGHGQKGYYALTYQSHLRSILNTYCNSEIDLGNYKGALKACDTLMAKLHATEERMVLSGMFFILRDKIYVAKNFNYDDVVASGNVIYEGDELSDTMNYRAQARIIVSPDCTETKVVAGQVFMKSLDDAVMVAKNGDIIFLEEGTHEVGVNRKGKTPILGKLIISKAIFIHGLHPTRTFLKGTIIKDSPTKVVFKKLTHLFGKPQTDHVFSVCEGEVLYDDCVIRTSGPTGFLLENPPGKLTTLRFENCNIAMGDDTCNSFVNIVGSYTKLEMTMCYISGFHMVITMPLDLAFRAGNITLKGCIFAEVQNGAVILTNYLSKIESYVKGCHFRLISPEPALPSVAFAQTGGVAVLEDNYFYLSNQACLERAISLHSLTEASVFMNCIEGSDIGYRKDFICHGICLSECIISDVKKNLVRGMQLGIKVCNMVPEEQNVTIIEHNILWSNSVGIQFDDYPDTPVDLENRAMSPTSPFKSPPMPKAKRKLDNMAKQVQEVNLHAALLCNHFAENQYGVMCQYPKINADLIRCTFQNNAKQAIFTLSHIGIHMKFDECKFVYNGIHKTMAEFAMNGRIPKSHFRKQMMKLLEKHSNTPLRMRYNKPDYYVINFKAEEEHYTKKYSKPLINNAVYKNAAMDLINETRIKTKGKQRGQDIAQAKK